MDLVPDLVPMSAEDLTKALDRAGVALPAALLDRLIHEGGILRAAATVRSEAALLAEFVASRRGVRVDSHRQNGPCTGLVKKRLAKKRPAGPVTSDIDLVTPPDSGSYDIARIRRAVSAARSRYDMLTYVLPDQRRVGGPRARSPSGAGGDVLARVLIVVKDNIDVAGAPSRCNSRAVPPDLKASDADVVSGFKACGAVVLGKVVMEEFGLGGASHDALQDPPVNPKWPAFATGGSSSGCAAAVASGLVPLAIGSDSAGSVRVPAAYCGVLGLKPTYDLVSTQGLQALAPSLDHIGLVAKNADYLRRGLLAAMPEDGDRLLSEADGREGLRIGILDEFIDSPYGDTSGTRAAVEELCGKLSAAGVECVSVGPQRVPKYDVFRACGAIILICEAYNSLQRYVRQAPELLSLVSLRRLCLGATVPEALYRMALEARADLAAAVTETLQAFDLLICATAIKEPPSAKLFGRGDGPASSARAVAFNVSGHPALAMPLRARERAPPVSLQIIGPMRGDLTVVQMAARVGRLNPEPERAA
jgi:aspartyl-tRNA(Asn)/glutamyl-tRNA(Gln) amidotransferase subunit A